MKIAAIALILSLAVPAAAPARGKSSWADVVALRPGEFVRIETGPQRHEGAFSSATESAVTLAVGGAPLTVQRSEIQRLFVRTRSHRLRNTIIGAAVGVTVGAVLYGTLGSWFRNEGRDDTAWMLAVPIAVGTGTAAALPTGRMRRIYDARD